MIKYFILTLFKLKINIFYFPEKNTELKHNSQNGITVLTLILLLAFSILVEYILVQGL